MTREEYNKMINDLMDTEDMDELVTNCAKSGMIRASLYAFAMEIGEKVCDD